MKDKKPKQKQTLPKKVKSNPLAEAREQLEIWTARAAKAPEAKQLPIDKTKPVPDFVPAKTWEEAEAQAAETDFDLKTYVDMCEYEGSKEAYQSTADYYRDEIARLSGPKKAGKNEDDEKGQM